MGLGTLIKDLISSLVGRRKHELEKLKEFYDQNLGNREDYKTYLVLLIKQGERFGSYDEVKKIQELKKEELEKDGGLTTEDSSIQRINENIERLDYLKNIEEKLIECNLNLDGKKISSLYQLVAALQTKSYNFKKKKLPKKGFKGFIYL